MRLIDLLLDQLSTNSLLCRLRYDSSPCPSSPVFLRLLLSFLSESVPRIYREGEKEQYKKTYRAKNEKESTQHKKEGNTIEREKLTMER